jgi:hypothetical protein
MVQFRCIVAVLEATGSERELVAVVEAMLSVRLDAVEVLDEADDSKATPEDAGLDSVKEDKAVLVPL